MLKAYLNLICLLALCTTLEVKTLTREMLDNFKLYPDYKNHIVFFSSSILESLKADLEIWDGQTDIKFYLNDCKNNKLPECEDPEGHPFLLMYNRVLIKYSGNSKNFEDMKEWMDSRITKNTKIITSEKQMTEYIEQTPDLYCLCTNDKLSNDEALFFALAKELPFLNYCVIRNEIYYQTLGLKPGNLTFFKNSTTNRQEFIYPNRLDAWQWFVKANMLNRVLRVTSIITERFAQKQKDMDFYVLVCDLSFSGEKVLSQVSNIQKQLHKDTLGFDFYLAIQDGKESFNFNLYYHFAFDKGILPALIHVSLKSDVPRAGDMVRHLEFTSTDFSIAKLKDFKARIERREVEPYYFSDIEPKKRGFTGKGSQKMIQKLVASNIDEMIESSPNNYILLISALDIGCSKCDEFYKEFKQIASLLIEKDVTFGYLNVNKNQLSLQKVTQMPDLFIFKKDDKKNPIRLDIPMSFDHLRNFIRDTLGNSYYNPDQL